MIDGMVNFYWPDQGCSGLQAYHAFTLFSAVGYRGWLQPHSVVTQLCSLSKNPHRILGPGLWTNQQSNPSCASCTSERHRAAINYLRPAIMLGARHWAWNDIRRILRMCTPPWVE
jgi:hypothetical protein